MMPILLAIRARAIKATTAAKKEQAEASLKDTVKALTLPLIGNEYQLEFKPIAEYNEGADSNA